MAGTVAATSGTGDSKSCPLEGERMMIIRFLLHSSSTRSSGTWRRYRAIPTRLLSFRSPVGRCDTLTEIRPDQAPPYLQQFFDQFRLGLFVGLGIGNPFHDHPQQLGDGVADGVLADGDDEPALVVAVDELLESRLPAHRVGVLGIGDTAVAHHFGRGQELVVEQQLALDLIGEPGILGHGGVARGDLREKGAVEVDEPLEDEIVFTPETDVLEALRAPLDLPAGQALGIARQADGGAALIGQLEDIEIQILEEVAIDIAHVFLKQAVLPAVGEIGIVPVRQFGITQLLHVEGDEMVVQHADARYAGRGQGPGGVQAGLSGQDKGLFRVGKPFQHVVDDDLVHAVPDVLDVLRNLGATHRAPQGVEDALGGVVDDGGVEQVAVSQGLAVEQQVFRVAQQPVVVFQVAQVLGAVEELVGRHAFWHVQGNGAEWRGDLSWAGLHDAQSYCYSNKKNILTHPHGGR